MSTWFLGLWLCKPTGWTCGVNYGQKTSNVVELKYWQQIIITIIIVMILTITTTTTIIIIIIIAELQRAKSEAPWVRKIGNPSSRENLVMTSAYDRASERTSAQTRGEGERRLEIFLTVTHMGNSFLGGFFV